MTDYEVTYIMKPTLEDAEAESKSGSVAEIVRSLGGEVVSVERLGKRRLAYEIADVREGFYVAMRFRGEAALAKELERQLRLNEDVIRDLLIKLEDEDLTAPVEAVEV